MQAKPIIRAMEPTEETEVCALIERVFKGSVAPLYSEQSVSEFLSYVRPGSIPLRLKQDHFVLVAAQGGRIVGVAEVRDRHHISLLFVDSEFQKRGIGRELVRHTLEMASESRTARPAVTVNSSPNAVHFYERFGFESCGPEQTIDGVSFIPMILRSRERKVARVQ